MECLVGELSSTKLGLSPVDAPPQHKRARVSIESEELQQPAGVSTEQTPLETAASDFVFPILDSMLTERMASGCEDAIQLRLAQLRDALFEFDAQPPPGFHHCFEILAVCSTLDPKAAPQTKSVTSSSHLHGVGCKLECKVSLLASLESCLRVVGNKQHRLRKRLQKRRAAPEIESKSRLEAIDQVPNRRARRVALQETAAQHSDCKLTATIPHYLILFLTGSETVNHNHQIFLGDEIRSSCAMLGRLVPDSLASLITRWCDLPDWDSGRRARDGLGGTVHGIATVLMRGSVQFSTTASSLTNAAPLSPLLIEEILFNVPPTRDAQEGGASVLSLRGAGLRCTIRKCEMRGFLEQPGALCPSCNLNLVEVTNGCDCRIVSCELSGFLSPAHSFQSLVACSCKASLQISHSKLSFSERSSVLLHPSCRLLIDSCLIEHSKKSGICLSDPSMVCIRDSEVARNGKCGVEIFSNGFAQSPGENVVLARCQIHSNLQSGILLFNVFCSITGCRLSGNGLANLSCQQGSGVLLEGSTLSNSARSGLHACGSRTAIRLSSGNTFFANQEGDMTCLDGASIIDDCTATSVICAVASPLGGAVQPLPL
jgi:hypothetical protein